jgi:hypothetical protein
VEREYFGKLKTDAQLPIFIPDFREPGMRYASLHCGCGGFRFRLSGWLTVSTGKGAFFWRSLTRVWREARQVMSDGKPVDSPFKLPMFVRCEACERVDSIFDDEALIERLPVNERGDPRESLRCRACGRGDFELVVGVGVGGGAEGEESDGPPRAIEVISCCHRCHRQERIAWSRSARSDQEIRLDRLYGRR